MEKGEKVILKGFGKTKKIDVCLFPIGYNKIEEISNKIRLKLIENEGYLAVNDNSSPTIIYDFFQSSKKAYKQAIGLLYKKGEIRFGENGIYLIKK